VAQEKRLVDGLTTFYCILSFSALDSLKKAIALQEEVLDTHEELILTHQAMSVVLKCLGREEEAEGELELAVESTRKLDSLQVSLESLQINEKNGWVMSEPLPISSS